MPFEVYAQAAEKLIDENPLSLKRVAFVSSEDPDVIARAANLTRLNEGTRAHLRVQKQAERKASGRIVVVCMRGMYARRFYRKSYGRVQGTCRHTRGLCH